MDRACEICGIEYWEINPLKKIRFVCGQECKIRWIVRDEMEKIRDPIVDKDTKGVK
jgi:hypothetical protein